MSNVNSNRVSGTMTATQLNAAKAAIANLKAALPVLVGLSPDERKAIPKVSFYNKPFVDEAVAHIEKSPEFVPPYLNAPEIIKDATYYEQLETLRKDLAKLVELINDTQMLAGSELYLSSLGFYHGVKYAALNGAGGATQIYDSLRRRFEDQGNFTSPEDPAEDTGTDEAGTDEGSSDTPTA